MAPRNISRLEQLPCPLCHAYLERGKGRHGLVWLCRRCHAGAVTMPVLRKVAPRAFVNELWQAALHGGRPSRLTCPACAERFTEFDAADGEGAEIQVCVRCFWVWFSASLVSALAATPLLTDERPLLQTRSRRASTAADARRTIGSLGAHEIAAALPRRSPSK